MPVIPGEQPRTTFNDLEYFESNQRLIINVTDTEELIKKFEKVRRSQKVSRDADV